MSVFSFSESELASLRTFNEVFAELAGHGFVTDRKRIINPGVSWKAGGFVETNMTGYDRDAFYSYLTLFRQFKLNNEAHSFFKVCNLLYRRSADAERADLTEGLQRVREEWNSIWDGYGMVRIDDGPIAYTIERTFRVIVYGRVSHSSPEEAAEYRGLPDFHRNMLFANLQSSLRRLHLCLMNLSVVIKLMLESPDKRLLIQQQPNPALPPP